MPNVGLQRVRRLILPYKSVTSQWSWEYQMICSLNFPACNSERKRLRTHVYIDLFSCSGMWSCPHISDLSFVWKYWNILLTLSIHVNDIHYVSRSNICTYFKNTLCKTWMMHPMPQMFVNKLLIVCQKHCFFLFSQPHQNVLQLSQQTKLNSVALARKRTMRTERPPLVGELSANFCGYRVSRSQRNGFPRPLISIF
jgi:hypothetical protein